MPRVKEEMRKVKFLCPVCFKDSKVKINKWPKIVFDESTDTEVDSESEVTNVEYVTEAWLTVYGKCTCGYEGEFIDIDDGFVELIQYLNENGYETIFCCEGHFRDSQNWDYPYLIFICTWDDKTYNNIILKHLPESWKIYREPKYEGYKYDSEIRLYCKNFYEYPDAMKDLKEFIYKWFPVYERNTMKCTDD